MTGWADLLPSGTADATPAIFLALIMFMVPVRDHSETLPTWKLVQVSWLCDRMGGPASPGHGGRYARRLRGPHHVRGARRG